MAGIGFELRKLTRKDDLLGIFRAYTHATMASTGPWLFTVLAIGGITLAFSQYLAVNHLMNFRIVVIYNFGFSLVFAAPVFMVVTRYLADSIHKKNVTHTPTVLFMSLGLMNLLLLPLSLFYYVWYVDLSVGMTVNAIANLVLISSVWVLGVFMTALKDYRSVTNAFAIGMLLAFLIAHSLRDEYGDVGMLVGFNIGNAWIVFSLIAKVLAEYPYTLTRKTELKKYYRRYWELAVGGVFYNAAIWVDKWVMWIWAPQREMLPSKMVFYPDYDSGMFLAYLTIVPAMAIFLFSVETNFFDRYRRFYYDILEHKPLATIKSNYKAIIESIWLSTRNFAVVQGTVCLVAILLAAQLFELLNINYHQIGIFRLGTLGAMFHVLVLFEMIVLSYFDCRRITMWIQLFFLLSNALLTYLTIGMGFTYYGYGYFLSSLLTFGLTTVVLYTHIQNLPYHAFITNNNSLKASVKTDPVPAGA